MKYWYSFNTLSTVILCWFSNMLSICIYIWKLFYLYNAVFLFGHFFFHLQCLSVVNTCEFSIANFRQCSPHQSLYSNFKTIKTCIFYNTSPTTYILLLVPRRPYIYIIKTMFFLIISWQGFFSGVCVWGWVEFLIYHRPLRY